ncbi:MAG: TPM domain-containing protein [Erysipelotrichaceae bacterium]|nr:TPM domain-containing protein [Erysipelotrichaceae bacterium]
MKRLLKTVLALILLSLCVNTVFAADDHVIIRTDDEMISNQKLASLNEDLKHIADDYDANIYFIYDTGIEDSENAIIEYAEKFLASHSSCSNNVVLVVGQHYYKLSAKGTAADAVLNEETRLWNLFYKTASESQSPDAFADGIVDFYQATLRIIDDKVYNGNAPNVAGNPLVNDFADLLSDKEEEKLASKLKKLSDKYGIDAAVVTTKSTNGMKIADYADDFYDYNGYGKNGVLFVLDMGNSEIYISTSGSCKRDITDYGIDLIFDDMMNDLQAGRYYNAFEKFADDTDSLLKNAQSGNVIDTNTQSQKKSFGGLNVMISTIIGALSSLVTGSILKGQLKNTTRQRFARNYIVDNSFVLTGFSDMLVNRHVSRSPRRSSNDMRGSGVPSGGGSHIHTSSSGTSHGGHGSHF